MAKPKQYDCAIIGGGLAGLCLSVQLAKNGIKTILFEKEIYPFHKVCGEYISLESKPFLEKLGLDFNALNLPIINTLNITAPNGNKLNIKLPLGGFGISRYTLDNLLYKIALNSGVHVITNCKVKFVNPIDNVLTTSQGNFKADIICGSWGKRSNLDIDLKRNFIQPKHRKLSNYVGVKYHVKADLPDNVIELHNFKNGYCGISKIEDGKYCMCYLVSGKELKMVNGDIKKLETQILHNNPYLKKYFHQYPSSYNQPLTISQISFEPKETQINHIILLGDAAGLITPLCGNGMSMAMHASKLLATELFAYFNKQQSKTQLIYNYNKQWKKKFALRLNAGRFIQQLFGKEITTNLVIAILKRLPFLTTQLIKLTHGKVY